MKSKNIYKKPKKNIEKVFAVSKNAVPLRRF